MTVVDSTRHPISFSPILLEAVRNGSKIVTRRRIAAVAGPNQAPERYILRTLTHGVAQFEALVDRPQQCLPPLACPFGKPGDELWVQEDPQIILWVTNIRVEQIRAITEAQALAEGVVAASPCASAVDAFRALIDAIYPTAWARNEWVWVVEFSRQPPPLAPLTGALKP